jgi:hypothetical protein
VKENAELETARVVGDYDLIRRNTVFPTCGRVDEHTDIAEAAGDNRDDRFSRYSIAETNAGVEAEDARPGSNATSPTPSPVESPDVTMSETNAVFELWAIPLYFPTSYSLVKPYVSGFEMNSLDAPSLQTIAIDSNWQPK